MSPAGNAFRLPVLAARGAAFLTFASVLVLVARPVHGFSNLADHAVNVRSADMLPFLLWFALALCVPVVFLALHLRTPRERALWSLTALLFGAVYTTLVSFNYGIQLTYVRQRVLAGDLEGLGPWVALDPSSALFAVDIIGYFFLGLATFAAAPLFRGPGIEKALRVLCVVHGVMGVGGLVAIGYDTPATDAGSQWIGIAVLAVWGVTFGTILLLAGVVLERDRATGSALG